MSAAMMRRLGPLALLTLSGAGCGEPRLIDSFTEGQTRLRLEPRQFVGGVPCQKGTPGALQSYAVRLQQVTGDIDRDGGLTTVFSSGAVPCDQAVLFPAVAGRSYSAEIRGFDRAVNDAEVDALPGRWSATCGRGSESAPDAGFDPYRPTLSLRGVTVPIRRCTTFLDGAAGGVTSQIVVDQLSALGDLRCGQSAGEVASFQASLDGVTRTALCGDPLRFDVADAERYYTVALIGLELPADAAVPQGPSGPVVAPPPNVPDASTDAGEPLDASLVPVPVDPADAGASPAAPIAGVARWSTQCVGRSLPGVAALAYCDPLRPLP
jgi:hypothetical protein